MMRTVAASRNKHSVKAPMLKAYLKSASGQPPHIPAWVVPGGWAVFFTMACLLATLGRDDLGVVAAALIGWVFVLVMKDRYKAVNAAEQSDEVSYKALKALKRGTQEMGFEKRFPPEVLRALEEAVAAHQTAVARVTVENPDRLAEVSAPLDKALQACMVAAYTLYRKDDQGKSDWYTILDNRLMNDEVVDMIHAQAKRMREPLSLTPERFVALQELDMSQEETPLYGS